MIGGPSTGIGRTPMRASTSRTSCAPVKVCRSRCSVARALRSRSSRSTSPVWASAARSIPSVVWRTSTSGQLTSVRTRPRWGVESHKHRGRGGDGQPRPRWQRQGRHVDPGREHEGAGGDRARRRLDSDDGTVLHAQPPDGLSRPDLRAVSPSGVDERSGHGDGVDRAVGRPQHRSVRRRPEIRLQVRDLVGLHEPLAGSERSHRRQRSLAQVNDPLQRTRIPARRARAEPSHPVPLVEAAYCRRPRHPGRRSTQTSRPSPLRPARAGRAIRPRLPRRAA